MKCVIHYILYNTRNLSLPKNSVQLLFNMKQLRNEEKTKKKRQLSTNL